MKNENIPDCQPPGTTPIFVNIIKQTDTVLYGIEETVSNIENRLSLILNTGTPKREPGNTESVEVETFVDKANQQINKMLGIEKRLDTIVVNLKNLVG